MNSYLKNVFITAIIGMASSIDGAYLSTATASPPPSAASSILGLVNPAQAVVDRFTNNRVYRAYNWFTTTSLPVVGIKLPRATAYAAAAVGAYHAVDAARHPTRTIKSLVTAGPKAAISSALLGGLLYLLITHDGSITRELINTRFTELWERLNNLRETITNHTTVTVQASEDRVKNEIVSNKATLEQLLKVMRAESTAESQALALKLSSALEQLEKLEHQMQTNQSATLATIDDTHKKTIAIMMDAKTTLQAQINNLLREITEQKRLFTEQQEKIRQALEEQNKLLAKFEQKSNEAKAAAEKAELAAQQAAKEAAHASDAARVEAQATRDVVREEAEKTRAVQAEHAERLRQEIHRVAIEQGEKTRAAVLEEAIKTQGMQRFFIYLNFVQKRNTLKTLGRAVHAAAGYAPAFIPPLAVGAALAVRGRHQLTHSARF